MRDYSTARAVMGFVEFLAWAVVVIGVLAALAGATTGGSSFSRGVSAGAAMIGAMPGMALALLGLLIVVVVQMGRAGVDTAQMTGKLLQNSNAELAILRREKKELFQQLGLSENAVPKAITGKDLGLYMGVTADARPTPPQSAGQGGGKDPSVTVYRGVQITNQGLGVKVGGILYGSVEEVKARIDAGEIKAIESDAKDS